MFTLDFLLRMTLARRWWIIGTTLLVTVLAFLLAGQIKPSYTSTTSLMFDFPTNSPLTAGNNQRQLGSDYLKTQVDIMLSPKVAMRAFESLASEHKRQLTPVVADNEAALPPSVQRQRAITALQESLNVAPSKDSRIIYVGAESANPATAAAVANAVAEAYIDIALELRIEPAMRQAAWFNEQLEELRWRLEVEQRELSDFQQVTGIINLDERLDGETLRLEQLNQSLVEAQARTVDTQSRQLGRRHPEYQRAVKSEQAIVAAVESQREKLFSLKQERNQLALLRQDLDSSKATYNTALERLYDARLVSQLNQTNAAVLSPAQVAPERATNVALVVLLGLVLGLLAGFSIALLIEMLDRRIYSDTDASQALQLPVLGTI